MNKTILKIIWFNGKKTQIKLTRLLLITFLLILASMPFYLIKSKDVMATVPASVAGKPALYDNWNPIYEDGLVLFLRFDNESAVGENDTLVFDWSGAGNNGTVTGAVYNLTNKTLGDGAMQFDGVDDIITISDSPSLSANNLTSILFWMKAKNHTYTGNVEIFEKNDEYLIRSFSNADGDKFIDLKIIISDTVAVDEVTVQTGDVVPINEWVFLSFIANKTDVAIFINGIYNISTGRGLTIQDSSSDLIIGGKDTFFNGSIDEVMIFNRSLSASEITDIYNQQKNDYVIPYEDMNVISTVKLANGTFYLNDTNINGAIIIGADDITLDCNGATLQGNGTSSSEAIRNNKDNVTVKNCIIKNYARGFMLKSGATNMNILNNNITGNISISSWGIDTYNRDNTTATGNYIWDNVNGIAGDGGIKNINFSNNFIFNSTNYGIFLRGKNGLISYNMIEGTSLATAGIRLEDTNNTIVSYNVILDVDMGIQIYETNYSVIDFNNISNTIQNLIRTRGNTGTHNNNITNNILIDAGHNGIDINSFNEIIAYNTIINFTHNAIDFNDMGGTQSGNNEIFSNVISTFSTDNDHGAAIYLMDSENNTFYHNNITSINNSNIAKQWHGLKVDGTIPDTRNNYFHNNIISNIKNQCIWTTGNNTRFENNTLTNCATDNTATGNTKVSDIEVRQGTAIQKMIFFEGNIFTNGIARYSFIQDYLTTDVNETTTIRHKLQLDNGGNITFIYNGRKDFRVENNTITINNMQAPNDDIKNITSGQVIARNQTSFTLTIASNEEYEVGNFPLGPGPPSNEPADSDSGGGLYIPTNPDGTVNLPMNPDGSYNFTTSDGIIRICEQKTSLFARLRDKCKIENDSICQDAETPFEEDCKITTDSINCKEDRCIFKEIWFAKLALLGLTFLILQKKKGHGVIIFILIALLFINFQVVSIDIPQVDVPIFQAENMTTDQINTNIWMRMGNRVMPSNPMLGFTILVILAILLFQTTASRTKKFINRPRGRGRRR